jgi:hypothetical protein
MREPPGRFVITVTCNRLRALDTDDPFGATAAEYATAGSSCIAYSGRFFVDEVCRSVCLEMAVSFFPNWLEQRQRRTALQPTVDRPGGEPKIATLTWRKAQPN